MAGDLHDLARFVAAQSGIYDHALAELMAGAKRSHWMWFIFPQLAGLGHSAMARRYAIACGIEARAYLGHPILGVRLRACTRALLTHRESSAEAIMGRIDAVKLRSSLTLFDAVADDSAIEPFAAALDAFYGGVRDEHTLALLLS